ncbi:MAG: hypothetical protein V1790_17590 [Planctomycetota bacterium]
MRPLTLFLVAFTAFAGQSLRVTAAKAENTSVVAQAVETPCRLEQSIHDWTDNWTPGHPADVAACGIDIQAKNNAGALYYQIYWTRGTGGSFCGIDLSALPSKFFSYRFQIDHATLQTRCEAWDVNGTRFVGTIQQYTGHSGSNGNGAWVQGAGEAMSTAYTRLFTSLADTNSRPPVTADTGDLLEWKFDGGLTDSSGNGYTATLSGGSATYPATPGQTLVFPLLKTYGAPSWTNTVSLRAGHAGQLDGSGSYSQSDAGAGVIYFWQSLSGPSVPLWSSRTSGTPTLTGLVFGDYLIQLQVTDPAGQMGTGTAHIGAVATDDNGVVVNADPNVDSIFGPMIAYGRNPWGYADERALAATTLRKAVYETVAGNGYSIAHPSFIHDGAGTVSFILAGVGSIGTADTTLATTINATDLTIVVADATKLDLAGLPGTPVRICLGTGSTGCQQSYTTEEVRVCSASGNTLTVCYDGRGQNAQAWTATTTYIGQYRVTGTATTFLTDAAVPICPAGANGPAGRVPYSTGTVTMTPGSTAVTGVGTVWTTANGVTGGSSVWLRVAATHAVGTPFVFAAYVSSVGGATSITLARAYPADADAGTFTYKIVQVSTRYWGLGYTRVDASETKALVLATGCESETAAYGKPGIEYGGGLDNDTFSGKTYTFVDGLGYRNSYGPNFYGEGLAHRALYYRSGLTSALTAANEMDDNWIRNPEVSNPGGSPLNYGGGALGAIANVLLNSSAPIGWGDVRPYVAGGAIGAAGCYDYDARDSGYLAAALTLGANFDPDATKRAAWKASLTAVLTRDQNCKQTDNSWATSLWNNASPHLTLTNGSATAAGTGLTATNTGCKVTASGTGSATSASATLTGSGFTSGNMIAVTGTRSGSPYTGFYKYTGTSSPLTLSALWPGDTGSITWMIDSFGGVATIGESQDSAQLAKNWVCRLDSAIQITLQRAWDGANSTTSHIYVYGANGIAGRGQQPFMLGVKTHAFTWASQNDDPTISSGYAALLPLAAAWIYSTGYDPETQGLHYGRVFDQCEPYVTSPPGTAFEFRQVGCNYGLNPASIRAGRVLTAEASSALRAQYEAVPTPTVQSWGDTAYGSVWGYPPYTTGGVYSDSNYVRDENSDVSLGAYKWTGFFFGMGMAHQWPAVRLGGVAPEVVRAMQFGFFMPAGATLAKFTSTAPSGKVTITTCSSSPCQVNMDARQGNHPVFVEYLTAGLARVSLGAPMTVKVE